MFTCWGCVLCCVLCIQVKKKKKKKNCMVCTCKNGLKYQTNFLLKVHKKFCLFLFSLFLSFSKLSRERKKKRENDRIKSWYKTDIKPTKTTTIIIIITSITHLSRQVTHNNLVKIAAETLSTPPNGKPTPNQITKRYQKDNTFIAGEEQIKTKKITMNSHQQRQQ